MYFRNIKTLDIVVKELSRFLVDARKQNRKKALVIGISGMPGIGKTTLAKIFKKTLEKIVSGEQVVIVSIDDFYYTREERKMLNINKWELGVHNLIFAEKLKQLKESDTKSAIKLPIFDKRKRDRSQKENIIEGSVSFVLFEGFGVGLKRMKYVKFSQHIDYLILLKANLDICKKWRCDAGWKDRRNFNYKNRQDFNIDFERIWLQPRYSLSSCG